MLRRPPLCAEAAGGSALVPGSAGHPDLLPGERRMEIPAHLRQDDWQRFTVSKSSRCEAPEQSKHEKLSHHTSHVFAGTKMYNMFVWQQTLPSLLPSLQLRCSPPFLVWFVYDHYLQTHVSVLVYCIHCIVDFPTSVVAEQETTEKGF